jgi:hypothetical protein
VFYFLVQQEPAFTSVFPLAFFTSAEACSFLQQAAFSALHAVAVQHLPDDLQQSLSVQLFFLHISIHCLLQFSLQHFGSLFPATALVPKVNRHSNAIKKFFISFHFKFIIIEFS